MSFVILQIKIVFQVHSGVQFMQATMPCTMGTTKRVGASTSINSPNFLNGEVQGACRHPLSECRGCMHPGWYMHVLLCSWPGAIPSQWWTVHMCPCGWSLMSQLGKVAQPTSRCLCAHSMLGEASQWRKVENPPCLLEPRDREEYPPSKLEGLFCRLSQGLGKIYSSTVPPHSWSSNRCLELGL